VKVLSERPLRLLVAVNDAANSEDIAREFSRKGFEVRVTSDRAEILRRAFDRSADLYLLQAPADSADMLLFADQLQSSFPNLAGRILFLPECPPSDLGEMVGKLAPVMQFLSHASERFGEPAGRMSPEGSA
jgi:PleD family two-component response regulator